MEILNCKPYTLDINKREFSIEGQQVPLTSKEFELALYFFRHKDAVLSRKNLLEDVWGVTADLRTRTVDAHVSRLRHKLQLSDSPWKISSIYKYGYCLHSAMREVGGVHKLQASN